MMMTSASATACSISLVAISFSGSVAPGKYFSLVCRLFISSTVSWFLAHNVIGAFRATSEATVVPHEPPPNEPTRNFIYIVLFNYYSARLASSTATKRFS